VEIAGEDLCSFVFLLLLFFIVFWLFDDTWTLISKSNISSALIESSLIELDHFLDENTSETLELFKLDLVVTVLVDLSEDGIDILICDWSTNVVLAKELGQEKSEFFAVKAVIFISVIFLKILGDLLVKKFRLSIICNQFLESLFDLSVLEVFYCYHEIE